jgi:predicted O-methyltransferase YrrM
MVLKDIIKKIWFSISNNKRLAVYDYPISTEQFYQTPHKKLLELIHAQKSEYIELLSQVEKYKNELLSISDDKEVSDTIEPGWNNNHLPALDMIMLYTLIRELKPKTYLEIGSGTSTRMVHKARKDGNIDCSIISIDPFPRKEINSVADKLEKKNVQDVSLEYFKALGEGDIIFFDGTHVLSPGSDVQWFFLEILPLLKKGVYVQVHDVYLPFDYPLFMIKRHYNEQYILSSWLLGSTQYKIICPNYFIYSQEELHASLHFFWSHEKFKNMEKHGGSFWFRME